MMNYLTYNNKKEKSYYLAILKHLSPLAGLPQPTMDRPSKTPINIVYCALKKKKILYFGFLQQNLRYLIHFAVLSSDVVSCLSSY